MLRLLEKITEGKKKYNTLLTPNKQAVLYKVKLSFKTFFQVWYYDENQQAVIREFFDDSFELATFIHPSTTQLVLKAFVTNPMRKKAEQVVLSIFVDENIIAEKDFAIQTADAAQNKWCGIYATL